MDVVETRERRKNRQEERPKPVVGSIELDAQQESRVEQGRAFCFDKEVSVIETEPQVSSVICDDLYAETNNLCTETKTCSRDLCRNRFDRKETVDSLVLAKKTFKEQNEQPATNFLSNYETMELICPQEDPFANGSFSIHASQNMYCGNTRNTFESANYMKKKVENDYIRSYEERQAESKKRGNSEIQLTLDRNGRKSVRNENNADSPESPIELNDEMKPNYDPKTNILVQESNTHDSNDNSETGNASVKSDAKLLKTAGHEMQNYTSNNETEHIYLDMTGYRKCNESVELSMLQDEEDDHFPLCRHKPQSTYTPLTTTTTLHIKTIQREGFLQKQGGVDRNQGWKKRWFRLDAKSLRYYRDKESSASLRIIPVALMKSVYPVNDNRPKSSTSPVNVSDLFSTSGRPYQFTLECKQRTFLFGTDSLENCQQWQSTLMMAIIEYQKNNDTYIPYGGEMSSPDISGLLKFDNNKTKYFVAVKGNLLRYYHNLEDFAVDCPINELLMEMTSVKEIRKTALQLDSRPEQKFVLNFELESDTQKWKTYLETAISRAIGDDKILNKVWENNDNRICADCYAPDPEWASINMGIVICNNCAGPHRSLGVNRSKVRSLRMDNIFKDNENIIDILETIGNRNSNLFWCKKVEDSWIIDEQTSPSKRQKYIEEKYVKKRFADILLLDSKEELNAALYSAVVAGDIIATMVALFSGADMNSKCPDHSKSILDVANESNFTVVKEFLGQNKNTDVDIVCYGDDSNEKSISESSKKTSIYKDGYLYKTGPNLKSYDKRYCVLHYGRITYFRDNQKKGFVDLADATSVSVVTGHRKYSFDINLQTKNRTYRFAAPDEALFGEWLNVIIQVICPYESEEYDKMLMAGYFYFKKQLTFWAKVWLVLDSHALHIRYRDDSTVQTIPIERHMKCLQYNVGRHLEKTNDVIKQLDNNQSIELISAEGHVVAYLQGMTIKDTRNLFCLLETSISG